MDCQRRDICAINAGGGHRVPSSDTVTKDTVGDRYDMGRLITFLPAHKTTSSHIQYRNIATGGKRVGFPLAGTHTYG